MGKPVAFLSHSSKDGHSLKRLRELLLQKSGGAIDFFLSSDGQSIPLGRNWAARIEDALKAAGLVLAFVSPSALRSRWLYFECGYALSHGKRVVPIGILGVDLGNLDPPLSLLQGFNLRSEDGLNNVIVLANEVFAHSHARTFTSEDYVTLFQNRADGTSSVFGRYSDAIDSVTFSFGRLREGVDPLAFLAECCRRREVEFERWDTGVRSYGVEIECHDRHTRLTLVPELSAVTFPIADELVRALREVRETKVSVSITFHRAIQTYESTMRISARLFGSEIKMSLAGGLTFRDTTFTLGHAQELRGPDLQPYAGPVELKMVIDETDTIPSADIAELIDLLFQRGVLDFVNVGATGD